MNDYTVIGTCPADDPVRSNTFFISFKETSTSEAAAFLVRLDRAESEGCPPGDIEIVAVFEGRHKNLY